MKYGVFITLEGPEGAGKTTILNLLTKSFEAQGIDVIQTREPGGIDIAEQIRSVILNEKNTRMDARTEALLYAAARRQHLIEKVRPALEKGSMVFCDRFIDSSLAYQGFARGLGMKEVYSINQFAIEGMMPDLTLYFDIDPVIGIDRIKKNKEREINRLDLESMEFHSKVREGYHILTKENPNRIFMINASQPIDDVYIQAENKVRELIYNRDY